MHFQISFVYELFVECPHECGQCTHHNYIATLQLLLNLYNSLPDQSQVPSYGPAFEGEIHTLLME